jgi:hypothetical protein
MKIRANAKFWRHWHGNPDRMRQIGYRCRKVGSRWRAWLLCGTTRAHSRIFLLEPPNCADLQRITTVAPFSAASFPSEGANSDLSWEFRCEKVDFLDRGRSRQ